MSKQDRKNEKWTREQEQKAEHARFQIVEETPVDPMKASAEAYVSLMTGPDAPEWSRPATHGAYTPAPATVDEVQAKITALEAEHADALANLNRVQDEQRKALNALLAQKREAEDAATLAKQAELPERLESTLEKVRSFIAPSDTAAPVAAPVDYVARGREALDRAQRRLRGEIVEEPVYESPAISEPQATTRESAIRARVAPNVVVAEKVSADLEAWSARYGKLIGNVHAADDDEDRYMELRNNLLRGLPTANTMLQTQSVQLVAGLLRSARSVVKVAGSMRRSIQDGTSALERVIARAEGRGSLTSQGDHSTSYYDQEREIVGALHLLGTANSDGINALYTMTKDVVERLERIAALREECKGTGQPPMEFENRAALIETTLDAAARSRAASLGDGPGGRPTRGPDWSPFGEVR
jgi:hypothetical protein